MGDFRSEIEKAEMAFEAGDLDSLKQLLPQLLENNVPAAIRLNASFFEAGTPHEECDRLFVEGMLKAAKLGDNKAKYQVGVFYDLGEYGFSQDKILASEIFKELADRGDPHCMWIHACDLLWGKGTLKIDTEKGLKFLNDAAEGRSAGACITIAGFYDKGEFGFEQSIASRDKYRKMALEYDDTTFDPYA